MWEHPEVGPQEFHAFKLLSKALGEVGFSIEMGVGDMPTAFIAE
jgi:aminobenzoyl-glutamate utilization protein B